MRGLAGALGVALLVVAPVAQAQDVPDTIHFTARLVDNGVPATGPHGFAFGLYDAATGGTMVWQEGQVTLAVQDGLLFRELGTMTPLDDATFDGRTLFLEIIVDGITMQPRLAIVSVPYSIRAGSAATADTLGSLTPGDVALAGHDHDGTYLPLGTSLSCTGSDKVVGLNGTTGAVQCGTDANTTYTAAMSGGLSLSAGNAFSVSFAGSGVATTVARSDHGHSGIYLPSGTSLSCTGTDKMTGISATTGNVVCGSDASTTYSAAAGGGLSLNASNGFGIDFASTNVWSGAQTFTATTTFPGGSWDSSGNVNVGERLRIGDALTSSILDSCSGGAWVNGADLAIWSGDNTAGCGDEVYIARYVRDGGEASTLEIANKNDPDDHVALMPSGNVGVGTTVPADKLDVAGNIRGGRTAESWTANRTGGVASTAWTTIPGLSATFNLVRPARVQMSATGTQRAITVDTNVCHQAYRFVVDGAAYGEVNHGQRIHVNRRDSWWQTWGFSHSVDLPAGTHTIAVQTRESSSSGAMCRVCAESDGSVTAYSDCTLNLIAAYQ